MSHIKPSPPIQKVLLPKELLLYEARQSRTAYLAPLVLVALGFISLVPAAWEAIPRMPETDPIMQKLAWIFSGLHFGAVPVALGMGMLWRSLRAGRKNKHFITNYRVVELHTSLFDHDLQYILLHHVNLVRIKATILQALMFTGTMSMEDDKGKEHIEIPHVAKPKHFKEAIMKAKKRFWETSFAVEKDGILKQVQSKTARRAKEQKQQPMGIQ